MKALAKLALSACLMLYALAGYSQTAVATATTPDFSRAELDQMLAPVALYPDTILSHVLIAATYPLEVVQADRWAKANPGKEGQDAVNAADNEDWDPSVKALVAFPQILQRMSEDLAWTQSLGDAFLADEAGVMDSIQGLRQKAQASGNLEKMEYVRAHEEDKVIVIEPAVEKVVYVPYYDTRVVYGNWWWNDYPPVYWHYPRHHVYVGGFYWSPRIYVGPSFYFSSFHWHNRRVVVVDRHHRHHFHSGRSIVRYDGHRHWRHNPGHRRGVVYRSEPVRRHYGSNRESYRNLQERRGNEHRGREQHNQRILTSDRKDPRSVNHGNTNQRIIRSDADRVQQRLSTDRPNARRDEVRREDNKAGNARPTRNLDSRPQIHPRQQGDTSASRPNSTPASRPNNAPETTRNIQRVEQDTTRNVNPRTPQPYARDTNRVIDNTSRPQEGVRRYEPRATDNSTRTTTTNSRINSSTERASNPRVNSSNTERFSRGNSGSNNSGNKFRGSTESSGRREQR